MITVIFGVCGAGKSWLYREKYSHLPLFDISDIYRESPGISWYKATTEIAAIAKRYGEACVIEGVFLPGTPSRRLLLRALDDIEERNITFIQAHAQLDVCKARIVKDQAPNTEIRLEILDRKWHHAEVVHARE